MNTCIKAAQGWLAQHPKTRQWVWFIALWCLGLGAAMAMAYPIKLLIRFAG